jgi:hypothetical protein
VAEAFVRLGFEASLAGGVLSLGILATEALDASSGVHQLVFAGEERMAVGADFNVDVAMVRGTRAETVPAGADDSYFFVIRMDPSLWHGTNSFLSGSGRIAQFLIITDSPASHNPMLKHEAEL